MESTQYIDMDIHKDAISVAVMNSASKVVMESILETKAATILQFIYGLRGNLLVTLEEGTWAAWLYDLLKPYVTQVTVCNPRKNALLKSGNKGDRIDARKLAEQLRNGSLSAVYHGETDPPNAEGVVAQLSDAQQGSEASDESAQCAVPKLGHCLQRYASLRTPASVRMVEPDHRSRRALPSRIHLPTASDVDPYRQTMGCRRYAEECGGIFWPRAGNMARPNCCARFRVSARSGRLF
jgi:hypothetical protein